MPPEQLATCDIGLMNLICSANLPGSEKLDTKYFLKALDDWAADIRVQTEANINHYQSDPSHYHNMIGAYKISIMVSYLKDKYGIHYNMDIDSPVDKFISSKIFFFDPKDVFIFGLLGPDRVGTCSSMPALYVALGRRLGYPVKLVSAKSHLFGRWEGPDGTFNFEGTSSHGVFHSDQYYKTWPHPISDEEIRSGQYLRSMPATEELATFVAIRGNVLEAHDRIEEAKQAYQTAHDLCPNVEYYTLLANKKFETAGKTP